MNLFIVCHKSCIKLVLQYNLLLYHLIVFLCHLITVVLSQVFTGHFWSFYPPASSSSWMFSLKLKDLYEVCVSSLEAFCSCVYLLIYFVFQTLILRTHFQAGSNTVHLMCMSQKVDEVNISEFFFLWKVIYVANFGKKKLLVRANDPAIHRAVTLERICIQTNVT